MAVVFTVLRRSTIELKAARERARLVFPEPESIYYRIESETPELTPFKHLPVVDLL